MLQGSTVPAMHAIFPLAVPHDGWGTPTWLGTCCIQQAVHRPQQKHEERDTKQTTYKQLRIDRGCHRGKAPQKCHDLHSASTETIKVKTTSAWRRASRRISLEDCWWSTVAEVNTTRTTENDSLEANIRLRVLKVRRLGPLIARCWHGPTSKWWNEATGAWVDHRCWDRT